MNPIHLAQSQIAAVALMLQDSDDEQLKLDTFEGETDLFEIVRSQLARIEEDEGAIKELNEQISNRQSRKAAADKRIKRRREVVMALMECAGLAKLTLPEATLSVGRLTPGPVVTDEAAVPDELCRFTRKPDLTAIKAEMEAGAEISGVALANGGASLSVRRK